MVMDKYKNGMHIWRPDREATYCGKTKQEYAELEGRHLECMNCALSKALEDQRLGSEYG